MSSDSKSAIEQREQDLREIAVVIDSWDDIFSDFDPRPLGSRMVSGDFITELRRRYKETRTGDFMITIYATPELRNPELEKTVSKRLKQHFHQKFLQEKKTSIAMRWRGVVFLLVGICSLSYLTLATYYKWLPELTVRMVEIILSPLGWFGLWEGFSKLVDPSPAQLEDKRLYQKLARAKYEFKYIAEPGQ